jgi:hypothetical protein
MIPTRRQSMPKTVVIRGDDGSVQIEVLNYERPNSTKGTDANWLACRCGVTVWEFSCDVTLSVTTNDLVCFLAVLDEAVRSLKGTAVFTTPEAGLRLEIRFKAAGHADVIGTVQSQLSIVPSRTKLDFSFGTDQSFLSRTVEGLRTVIQQFPIRSGV